MSQTFFFFNENILWALLDFSLTVKAATLIFISGCSSAISSAKEGKSGFIYSNQPPSVGSRRLPTLELVAFTIRHVFFSDIPHPLLHTRP